MQFLFTNIILYLESYLNFCTKNTTKWLFWKSILNGFIDRPPNKTIAKTYLILPTILLFSGSFRFDRARLETNHD